MKTFRIITRWIAMLVIASGMIVVAGCASIITGTKQDVKIKTDPDAADVKVEQLAGTSNTVVWEGKAPASVKLSRNGSYLVTVSLSGYQKAEIPVSSGGMNGWVWGNILIGGLVGIAIDYVSGAAKNLEPGELNVKLVAVKTGQTTLPAGVYAVVCAAGVDGKTQARAFPLKQVETAN